MGNTINILDGTNLSQLNVTGVTTVAAGSTAAPSITPTGDSNTGIFFPSADTIAFGEGGSEAARIDSSGRFGLGTTSPSRILDVKPSASSSTLGVEVGTINSDSVRLAAGGTVNTYLEYRGYLGHAWFVDTTERARIDSSGRFGIGTTSPGARLGIEAPGTALLNLYDTTYAAELTIDSVATNVVRLRTGTGDDLAIHTNGSEKARLTSDGRWLVGTSSASASSFLHVQGRAGATTDYAGFHLRRGSLPSAAGQLLGIINFTDNSENQGAWIYAESDAGSWTSGSNHRSRLVFATTADGASSPTERMRINNTGSVMIQTTQLTSTSDGCYFNSSTDSEFHQVLCHSSSNSNLANLYINRQASDGQLIEFRQADTAEGVISVSGTTVTYGGGHLARWSQLPNNEDPSGILKGTIMSNLDEMCEWGEEDNEQLNKTKISDVEGDKNVAGVFVSTSFSDDGPLDFFVAMTGDMVIRIAEGVIVERGDLLMSAGDGTAKPQDDDIIRSKTIAKVTSTNVSCTYDDGSYCVPCVLMAC